MNEDTSDLSSDSDQDEFQETPQQREDLGLHDHIVTGLSAAAAASAEQTFRLNPNMETVVLFKGRKYNWNAKINLHVHIIEHTYANTIEIVGYNTNTFAEADHIYVSSSYVYQKADDPDLEEKIEIVQLEYQKLKAKSAPSFETIRSTLQRQRASTYILDRLHVNAKPTFQIDVKETDKNYRISNQKQSTDRRPSTSDTPLPDVLPSHAISLAIRKPEIVVPSVIKRVGKSATLIGEVMSVKLIKEDEQLQKIIASVNSSSFNNQAKRILNRVSLMQRASPGTTANTFRRRGGIFQASNIQNTANLKQFAKFRNDNDLLQESLSFLHVSDMVEMLCVCKRWQQVLSYALKNMNPMVITSKDYYHNCNLDRDFILSRVNYVEARHRRLLQIASHMTSRPNTMKGRTTGHFFPDPSRKHHNNQRDAEDDDEEEGRRRSFDSTEGRFMDDYHQQLSQSRNGLTSTFHNHNNLLVVPEKKEWPMLRAPQRFVLRQYYCKPETVQLFIRNASRSITELRLHYVVLNRDAIATLSSLTGRLKTLVLGTIRIDDSMKEGSGSAPPSVPHSPRTQPAKPTDQSMPSSRSAIMNSRRLINAADATNSPTTPSTPHSVVAPTPKSTSKPAPPTVTGAAATTAPPPVTNKPKAVKTMRFMDAYDLKEILFACGSGLTHLEVSLTVGEISRDILKLAPNLTQLVAHHTLLAPNMATGMSDVEGNVSLEAISNALMGIPMPDLLALISETSTEAFCLTDRRGKIVTVNSVWERLFGHSRVDVVGTNLDFLGGPLTSRSEFEIILQGLKNQLRPEEVTTFLYTKEEQPVLIQVILLPNLSKWKGTALNFDCLESDFIAEMALEQEELSKGKEGGNKKTGKLNKGGNTKDWRATNRELSYHLVRFGMMSSAFVPYQKVSHR